MKQCFVAVDLGATSGRVILGVVNSDKIEMEEILRFPNHIIEVSGHRYWDLFELYRNIIEGLRILGKRTDLDITSIGIDTWGVDFVCFSKDSTVLRQPYSYRDDFTQGVPECFFRDVLSREDLYNMTGIQVMNFNTIYQLHAMTVNNDNVLKISDKLLFIPDALSFMLTGEAVTEYTIATTSQLVNAKTRKLDELLINKIGLSENQFGRFVFPGERIGVLDKNIRRITGLGEIPVIAVAGHDTASAVLATPAQNPRFAYLSSGTWSLMGVEIDEPVINQKTAEYNFTNEGGADGSIRLLKNICGMWLLERCKSNWGDITYPQLISEASSSEPFRSLIYPDDELFVSPLNMETAIKDYCKRTGQPVPETRGEIVRCIFESLALRYRQVLNLLSEVSDMEIDVLHVIGGGSRNETLNQWVSNSIGKPVIAGPSEATALGNIMVQAVAYGLYNDYRDMRCKMSKNIDLKFYKPQNTEEWDSAYTKYLEIINN